ncbi:MAG: ABC transporter permease [Chloroflexi bacterium]|nr:MAG: ABC transporter permease [Chloroflexota bacterium]
MADAIALDSPLPVRRPLAQRRVPPLFRHRGAVLGVVIVAGILLVAVAAPILARHDPLFLDANIRLQAPNAAYPFGTDNQGRDTYSRVVFGARLSLLVGVGVALLTLLIGTTVGLLAGFYRRFDSVIMRVMDGLMAFPGVILAIAIMAAIGPRVENVIFSLTVVYTPRLARVMRSAVLQVRELQYVEAAQAIGVGAPRLLVRHILPNCMAILIVQSTFIFADAVLGEASLSFLGAGTPPEIPSWGNMLGDARQYLARAPWTMLAPGAALMLAVLGLNLLGDGVRDLLDPRLRRL